MIIEGMNLIGKMLNILKLWFVVYKYLNSYVHYYFDLLEVHLMCYLEGHFELMVYITF